MGMESMTTWILVLVDTGTFTVADGLSIGSVSSLSIQSIDTKVIAIKLDQTASPTSNFYTGMQVQVGGEALQTAGKYSGNTGFPSTSYELHFEHGSLLSSTDPVVMNNWDIRIRRCNWFMERCSPHGMSKVPFQIQVGPSSPAPRPRA